MSHFKFTHPGFAGGSLDRFDVADGAPPVAKSTHDNQCWGLVRVEGSRQYRRCTSRVRGAGSRAPKCTCYSHRAVEDAAQKMLAGEMQQKETA